MMDEAFVEELRTMLDQMRATQWNEIVVQLETDKRGLCLYLEKAGADPVWVNTILDRSGGIPGSGDPLFLGGRLHATLYLTDWAVSERNRAERGL
jgi:hypothetical protein